VKLLNLTDLLKKINQKLANGREKEPEWEPDRFLTTTTVTARRILVDLLDAYRDDDSI